MRKIYYFTILVPVILIAQSSSRGFFAIGGFDPRAVGIGGSYVALETGAASTYWNPAGLGWMKGKEVRVIYSNLMQNMANQTFLAYGQQDEGNGAYGLAIFNRLLNPSYLTDGMGHSYSMTETFLALSYAKKTSRFLSLGATVKYYNTYANFNIDSLNSGNGFGLDFGLRYRPQRIFSLGLIVRDAPGFFSQAGSRERMSAGYELGIGYSPLPLYKVLTIAVSLAGIEDNIAERAGLGFEWIIAKTIALRAGFTKYIDAGQTTSGAIGIGFFKKTRKWDMTIDYGFQGKDNNLGLNHRASVGIKF